jgi:O-antigen ligase
MLPIVALAIARTGSRGGLAALAAGLMVIVLRKGTAWARLRNAVIVAVALTVFLVANFSLEMNRQRWEKTLEGGTMAGRETIFPAAWKLFLERPLTGWGPATHYKVLGARFFRDELDTHNLYLWLLTQVGLFGTVPYFVGMLLCLRSSWRARAGPQGVLPLALMVLALTINMSLTWHEKKVYWVILALALASSQPILERFQRARRPAALGPARSEPAAAVSMETS